MQTSLRFITMLKYPCRVATSGSTLYSINAHTGGYLPSLQMSALGQKQTYAEQNAVSALAPKAGTQGRYDIVIIVDAPDEVSATALNLSLSALGNIRTESLRAFSSAEMMKIVAKML